MPNAKDKEVQELHDALILVSTTRDILMKELKDKNKTWEQTQINEKKDIMTSIATTLHTWSETTTNSITEVHDKLRVLTIIDDLWVQSVLEDDENKKESTKWKMPSFNFSGSTKTAPK